MRGDRGWGLECHSAEGERGFSSRSVDELGDHHTEKAHRLDRMRIREVQREDLSRDRVGNDRLRLSRRLGWFEAFVVRFKRSCSWGRSSSVRSR